MVDYSLPGLQEMTLSARKGKMIHLEPKFWSVQIITSHVIYNSWYNILTDESSLYEICLRLFFTKINRFTIKFLWAPILDINVPIYFNVGFRWPLRSDTIFY